MRQKSWILLAAGSVLAAVLLAFIGIYIGEKDGAPVKISPNVQAIETHVLEKTAIDTFTSADLAVSYADITLVPSDGYYLEYALSGLMAEPSYSISEGKLTFREGNQNKQMFGFFSSSSSQRYYVNLYVPEEQYFDLLNIFNDSGDVSLPQVKAKEGSFELSYGDLNMDSFEGDSFRAELSSGYMKVKTVKTGTLTLENEYGDVRIDALNSSRADIVLESGSLEVGAGEVETLTVQNDYGNVEFAGLNCGDGDFVLESGDFEIEKGTLGKMSVKNDYGSVKISLTNLEELETQLETAYGNVKVNGRLYENDEGGGTYTGGPKGEKSLSVYCDSGDIRCDQLP